MKETWQEREARIAAYHARTCATMREVAQLLGFTYIDGQSDRYRDLVHPDYPANGIKLVVYSHDLQQERLHIIGHLGVLGRFVDRSIVGRVPDFDPKIGVSSKRPANAIATEIRRRLLPGYSDLLGILRKRQAAYEAAERTIDDLADLVAEAGNCAPHRRSHGTFSPSDRRIALGSKTYGQPRGTAIVNNNRTVSFELSGIPPELAAHIASLLGEYVEDEGEPT